MNNACCDSTGNTFVSNGLRKKFPKFLKGDCSVGNFHSSSNSDAKADYLKFHIWGEIDLKVIILRNCLSLTFSCAIICLFNIVRQPNVTLYCQSPARTKVTARNLISSPQSRRNRAESSARHKCGLYRNIDASAWSRFCRN